VEKTQETKEYGRRVLVYAIDFHGRGDDLTMHAVLKWRRFGGGVVLD